MRQEKYIRITYEGLLALVKAAGGRLPKDASIKTLWLDYESDAINMKINSSTYDEVKEGSPAICMELDCDIDSKVVEHSLNLRR